MKKAWVALVLLIVGCAGMPAPQKSEYFTSKGGGFVTGMGPEAEVRYPNMSYSLTLTPTAKVTRPLYLLAEFDHPSGGKPIVARYIANPGQNVVMMSPVFDGSNLKRKTNYRVNVGVYEDPATTRKIGTHVQELNSGRMGR